MSDDRFKRTRLMIGDESFERLCATRVTVVGLGAVGSYATEALARSGVGRLRLVDHDRVTITNINRQLYALESTLGTLKVDVARARVLDINPACEVETLHTFAHTDSLDTILAGSPDLVVDCIDTLIPKLEMICACIDRAIPSVSSMGAALRLDPSCVRQGMISEVTCCPLARRLRKLLAKRGVTAPVPCVYSVETVDRDLVRRLAALPPEADAYARGRPRSVLASLPTVTGIFGLTIAALVMKTLIASGRDGV